MKKKFTKLVGLSIEDFNEFRSTGQIQMAEARLIPYYKMGDEMALTSIFLSSLRLVKEMRDTIFQHTKISKAGQAYYFTEFTIPEIDKNSRIDGLVIIVSAGKIKDAAFFEMKNKNNVIEARQIEKYQAVAKLIGVDKIITVSNEFVSDYTISPVSIKKAKNISFYHFSWTYILTVAHLLIIDNETNIDDADQVEIMNEVIKYLERKESGVGGYNQMSPGWKNVVDKIISGSTLKESDKDVIEAAMSWQQEEKDMALMLSRELGVLVNIGSARKKDGDKLLKSNIKDLVKNQVLESTLKVKGSASDIKVVASFNRRALSMTVSLTAPLDKGMKGRCGWIIRQLQTCQKRSPEYFKQLESEIYIETVYKFTNKTDLIKFTELEKIYDFDKDREITEFKISAIRDIGKGFSGTKKFVEVIESMLLVYYGGIVQNLSNWERPAPKILDT